MPVSVSDPWQIKVIGDNEGPFVSDIRTLCSEITGQAEEDVPVRWRDKGKYRSITLRLHFEDADTVRARWRGVFSLSAVSSLGASLRLEADSSALMLAQVYAVYAAIDADPRVKFKI